MLPSRACTRLHLADAARTSARLVADRAGGGGLHLMVAVPVLAVAFACVFDAVMIATTWQYARRCAGELVQDAAETAAAQQGGREGPVGLRMDAAFARAARAAAPADVLAAGAMVLRLYDRTGADLSQWRRGAMPLALGVRTVRSCPQSGFQAAVALRLPDWLVAPGVVRALLPVVRAQAFACTPTAPQDRLVSG